MTKRTARRMRTELLKRRQELMEKLDGLDVLQRIPAGVAIPESGDQAIRDLEGEGIALLAESQSDELQRIEQALDRMEVGKYGICQACGRSISQERLRALPSATLCVECKRSEEASEQPGSGNTYPQRWGKAEEMLRELEGEKEDESE